MSSSIPLIRHIKRRENSSEKMLDDGQKQMTFEMKNNSFNRKIEIKSKHEEMISRGMKSPPILRSSKITSLNSPKSLRVERTMNIIPQVHIDIQSSQKKTLPSQSNSIETIFNENQQRYDHRPLRDLIQRNNSQPANILPPKSIPPFQPVILHKKYQVLRFLHERNFYLIFKKRNQLVNLILLKRKKGKMIFHRNVIKDLEEVKHLVIQMINNRNHYSMMILFLYHQLLHH